MTKALDKIQLDHLMSWLQRQHLNTQKLHSEFSDVLPFARLIKSLFPSLVYIAKYPSCVRCDFKLNSWENFNVEVLQKLGLKQNYRVLKKLAQGSPKAINSLLYKIMLIAKKKHCRSTDREQAESSDVFASPVSPSIMIDKVINDTQSRILYATLVQTRTDLQMKDLYLCAARKSIEDLQKQLQAKEKEIQMLQSQMRGLKEKKVPE